MKINELKDGMSDVVLKAKVAEFNSPRQVNTKFGTTVDLFELKLEDDTGTVKLVLWGKQAEGLAEGKEVEIAGGFTKSFRDELQVGIGKTGSIKVVE